MFSYAFTDSRYHINFAKVENGELLPRIKNIHHNCTSYCHQPLDDLCRRNKFHISKTVRLGLDVASKFLEDPNVKIIYVARDPRGNNKFLFLSICTVFCNNPTLYLPFTNIHPFYFWQ